jgi:tetratricopeptide (TPR) repeat protein
MRSLSKPLALLLPLAAIFTSPSAFAQQTPDAHGRVLLVLPFENRSGNPSLNWIGDSFPDTLNKRLSSAGFLTISRDDRAFALDHLGLPPDFKPSRATTIRIAQQLDANYVIVGSFDNLRLCPPVTDEANLPRLFDGENAIAWELARVLDPHFAVSEQTFLAASGSIPLPAFEDYIRGDNATTDAERLKRLNAAVGLVPDYAAALLSLGKAQYADRDFEAATATLAKVAPTDRLALEANFYLGLANFNSAHYAAAKKAFEFVATRLPLPEVVNDEAVALSRQGKDSVDLFQRASNADPSDEDYHYNLSIALFRRGDTAAALREADAALKLKAADNEAIQLRAQLKAAPAGSRLDPNAANGFSPLERIRRNYSEAGFRQAAFQLDQVRAVRLSMLTPDKRAAEYTQLGREYFAQGLLPEAEAQFQSALSADPNSAAAHAGMAQVREASGDPAGARDEAKTSIIMQPNVPALLVLARLDLADKQLPAADQDISRALQLEPANAEARALRQALILRQQNPSP